MKRIYGSLELGGARNFHDIFLCDEAPVDGANPSIHFHQRRNEKEEINSGLSFVKGISEILSLMRKSFDNRICRGFIGYYTKVEAPVRDTLMLLFSIFLIILRACCDPRTFIFQRCSNFSKQKTSMLF